MTEVRGPLFGLIVSGSSIDIGNGPTVETLSHAARYMRERPPSADVVVLETADALAPFRDAIEALTADSNDTNSQYEFYSLAAAMEHLDGGADVRVALLWSDEGVADGRELVGMVPYRITYGYFGLPLPVWRVWHHLHSYICTPLLKRGRENQALQRFMSFADHAGAAMIEFPMFEVSSAFDRALCEIESQQRRQLVETERHERAFLKPEVTEDAYLATHIRKKKRKEFNRLWNRLLDLGELRIAIHENVDVRYWTDRFLRLEASGWKGKRGTALKADTEQSAYFEKICRGAAERGKLHCSELTLDGKPLAMLTSFRASDGLYTFKIAFDERYSRYSPGALLMLKLIGEVQRDERIVWADSCAIPNHPMIDQIWAERREMRSVIVAGSSPFARPAVQYAAWALKTAEQIRASLRKHYNAFRNEKKNEQLD